MAKKKERKIGLYMFENDMTIADFAAEIGCSFSTGYAITKGIRPSRRIMKVIAGTVNKKKLKELFDWADEIMAIIATED